jgi:hypothetical protein
MDSLTLERLSGGENLHQKDWNISKHSEDQVYELSICPLG